MAIIANIALGLLGLGLLVFIHELGHFIAARLVGIEVEAFSIGWGKPILKKKAGGVEYRLGMFPVGGYCKMRGGEELKEALEKNADGIEPAQGSYYAASPLRRIAVCAAGPLFNLALAVALLSVVFGAGFEFGTFENRVVLASDLEPGASFPADEAGIMTGDRIIEINGRQVSYWHEIQEAISRNPERRVSVTVERQGEAINFSAVTDVNRSTGAGMLGVSPWIDAVIAEVEPGSAADAAGLMPGDRIARINGREVANSTDVRRIMEEGPEGAAIDFVRGGDEGSAELAALQPGGRLGITWATVQYRSPPLSPPAALASGVVGARDTLALSLRGFSLLFRGRVNPAEALSGPVGITYIMGGVATAGFERSLVAGLSSMAEILAIISIAICIMNLLPLPILDGGQIVLYLVELARRKPVRPKTLQVFQTAGAALIIGLMLFALFGDIMFLGERLGGG